MAGQAPQNSVWSAMEYKPPKGRCNYKASILTSCPCLRFMLHPVKAATSFDCDGCSHHASFHSLENPTEDAILKKWSEQETKTAPEGSGNKRRRIADKPADKIEVLELSDGEPVVHKPSLTAASRKRAVKQPGTQRAKPTSRRAAQADLQDTLRLVGS